MSRAQIDAYIAAPHSRSISLAHGESVDVAHLAELVGEAVAAEGVVPGLSPR